MRLNISTRACLASVGVDAGMVAVIAATALPEYTLTDASKVGSILAPTLALNDGRRFEFGRDFKNWDDTIPAIGMSANEAIKRREAASVRKKFPARSALTYAGACTASWNAAGFGFLHDQAGADVALVLQSLDGDGEFPVFSATGGTNLFTVLSTSFEIIDDESCEAVTIGEIYTGGRVQFVDPCDPHEVGEDHAFLVKTTGVDGYSKVWGLVHRKFDRVVGFAIEAG